VRKQLIERVKRMTGALEPIPENATQIGFGDHVPDFVARTLLTFNEFSKQNQRTKN